MDAPSPTGRHLRQWGLVLGVGLAYTAVRAWAAPEDATAALANARRIVDLEQGLMLFVERPLQRAALAVPGLAEAANAYYLAFHLPPILASLVYAYVRHPGAWPLVRDVAIAFTLLGLVVHVVYPTAPPWIVEGLGVQDTFGVDQAAGSPTAGNRFAAMPSMHFGWALLAGGVVARLAPRPWLRALGAAHPVLMGAAIVVTGNHFVLDAVASAVLLAGAYAAVVTVRRRAAPRDGPGLRRSRCSSSRPPRDR